MFLIIFTLCFYCHIKYTLSKQMGKTGRMNGAQRERKQKNMPNKNNKYRLYRYNWIHIRIRHPIFRRTLFVRLVEKHWPILYLFGFYVWPKATLIDAEAKLILNFEYVFIFLPVNTFFGAMRYGTASRTAY